MIRDERRYPGYCKLQLLCNNAPLPARRLVPPGCVELMNDGDGNVMMTEFPFYCLTNTVRHGPAATKRQGDMEQDFVPALKCYTWPKHYKQWTPNERRRDWPTPEMVHYMKSTGCFVVQAAHRHDDRDETCRISTSLAERCLMFSLNITQIRCYVLLKLIVKTFISPYLPDTISSYMCKTLLFHCIENTRKEFWKEHNLLQCVHQVLLYMIAAVLDENCPYYFNKSANLFVGKIDGGNKANLLQRLRILIRSKSRFLLAIHFDQISYKLTRHIDLIGTNLRYIQDDIADNRKVQVRKLMQSFFFELGNAVRQEMYSRQEHKDLLTASRDFITKGHIQIKVVNIVLPFMCSYVASIEANKSILQGTDPTPTCLKLFNLSLNSDVTSSRLKFASYLYSTGQLERTVSVLQDVEERMDDSVLMMCGCHVRIHPNYLARFGERDASQKYPTTDSLALCVMFSKAERQCCPRELQYEMFRSTDEERRNRGYNDDWMDLAVMDALSYLYYLQYMTYRYLGQYDQQYAAFIKLNYCVCTNEYLPHRETAFNVIGQCMEYEGWIKLVFIYYRNSLRYRPNNNAVRWHIIRLMARLAGQRGHQR